MEANAMSGQLQPATASAVIVIAALFILFGLNRVVISVRA